MNFQRIVCIDLEMCCWNDGRNPRTGEIIEIGLAEVDFQTKSIIQRSRYIVKPEADEVSPFCTQLTGLTREDVSKGVPLSEALSSIVRKYGGSNKIYAAWGRDDYVIKRECDAKGIPYPFKEFLNIATIHRISKMVKNKRYGHVKAMRMEGLEWEGRNHSGYDDAYNLARLVLHMFRKLQDKNM